MGLEVGQTVVVKKTTGTVKMIAGNLVQVNLGNGTQFITEEENISLPKPSWWPVRKHDTYYDDKYQVWDVMEVDEGDGPKLRVYRSNGNVLHILTPQKFLKANPKATLYSRKSAF